MHTHTSARTDTPPPAPTLPPPPCRGSPRRAACGPGTALVWTKAQSGGRVLWPLGQRPAAWRRRQPLLRRRRPQGARSGLRQGRAGRGAAARAPETRQQRPAGPGGQRQRRRLPCGNRLLLLLAPSHRAAPGSAAKAAPSPRNPRPTSPPTTATAGAPTEPGGPRPPPARFRRRAPPPPAPKDPGPESVPWWGRARQGGPAAVLRSLSSATFPVVCNIEFVFFFFFFPFFFFSSLCIQILNRLP